MTSGRVLHWDAGEDLKNKHCKIDPDAPAAKTGLDLLATLVNAITVILCVAGWCPCDFNMTESRMQAVSTRI
jgi:hypothetical protein